jgi:hypothetical protein
MDLMNCDYYYNLKIKHSIDSAPKSTNGILMVKIDAHYFIVREVLMRNGMVVNIG